MVVDEIRNLGAIFMSEKEFHSVANVFPLLQGEDFETFCQDILSKGLLEPIWLHPNGQIIDGRNRYRACLKVGIEPRYRTWDGNGLLVDFVLSLNLHRRHLTSGQKAALAVEIEPLYAEEAKERQIATLKQNQTVPEIFPERFDKKREARNEAAKAVGTNPRYVSDAKRIKRDAPKAFEQMAAGEISIIDAKKIARFEKNKANIKKSEWSISETERKESVVAGKTVVANCSVDKKLIQWAIDNNLYVPIDRNSIWGNPFILDQDGSREEVVKKYEWYFAMKPSLQNQINDLRGKVLGCWCYPKTCHGDVLIGVI